MRKLLLFLLLTAVGFAQNARYDNVASGPKGPVPFATVAVCTQPANSSTQPCSPLAALCSSLTDTTCNQPNPLSADVLGNYHFYVKQGQPPVTVQLYGPQISTPSVLADQISSTSGSGLFNGVIYVGGSASWAGADLGAQINTAYASACSSSGCRIHIIAGTYSYSTPISFNTANKPVILEGDGDATRLNFTAASGSAILFDYGQPHLAGARMQDITLVCTSNGNTASGVQLGSANGADSIVIRHNRIANCSKDIDFEFGTVGPTITENIIGLGALFGGTDLFGTCINMPTGFNVEGVKINNNSIAHCATGLIFNSTGDNWIDNNSWDDNTLSINEAGSGAACGFLSGIDNHFENVQLTTTPPYITLGNFCSLILRTGSFSDDFTVGTHTAFITEAGNTATYVGLDDTLVNSFGATVTQVVNETGSGALRARIHNFQTSLIPNVYTPNYASNVVRVEQVGSGVTTTNDGYVNNFPNVTSTTTYSKFQPTAGGNTYTFSGTQPGGNRTITIADPGSAATLGLSLNTTQPTYEALRAAGCATAAAVGATCDTTITWSTAFPNTSYTASCSGDVVTSGVPIVEGIAISTAKTASAITVRTYALTAAAAQFTTIDCVAMHD